MMTKNKKSLPTEPNTKPGYKKTKLGWIPVEWEVKQLGKFFKLSSGKTKPKVIQKNPVNEYVYPIYGGNGILGYSDEFNSEEERIIIGRVGEYCGITRLINKRSWITDNALYTKDILLEIDIQYLSYKLQFENLSKLRSKGGQPLISQTPIYIHQIALPIFLPEQKAIANLLGTWDEAITKTNALITQKELHKKWLMQNLLTGRLRLCFSATGKPFSGNWKRKGAGEIFKSVSKKGFEKEELLSATQINGIIPRSKLEGRVTMPAGDTLSFKLVKKGNFVISLRSFQGGLEYSYYRGLVSPAYTVLKSKQKIDDEFYKQYFKSYDFIGHLAVAVIGIRDGKQISYNDFCFVKIPSPSFKEQTAIAQVLQTADKEIEMLKAKLEKLKEQKKGLMQILLTGKKRLNLI